MRLSVVRLITRKETRDLLRDRLPPDADPDAVLRGRKVQAVLVIPEDFAKKLEAGERPTLVLKDLDGDTKSKVATSAAADAVAKWAEKAREVRFKRDGKPAD